MNSENTEYKTLEEFWPFYLSEHSHPVNRRLHYIGSSFALIFFSMAIVSLHWYFLLAGLFSGYGFAWIGHFIIQKNRPATFKYPLKSFFSDWRLYYCFITMQIEKEMEKYSIENTD